MKPKQQRIAIAEACGWKKEYILCNGMDCDVWVHPNGRDCRLTEWFPSYLSDLNAMHEAEKILSEMQYAYYAQHLYMICKTAHNRIRATAAQRAEAFLRTLNLWSE